MSDHTKRRLLFLLFFFSGVSALIYQVIWARMFSLVFGVTTFAVSTVLSAFMAGLSLGSLYFGRKVDKHKNPLRLFAFLEIAIGLFALLFPFLLSQLTHIYVAIYQQFHPGLYLFSIILFFLAFPLLFIPTALIGGTLPVLSKYFVRELKELGWNIGSLYSVNNLGAVIGSLIAGFFLIRAIGVTGTLYAFTIMLALTTLLGATFPLVGKIEKIYYYNEGVSATTEVFEARYRLALLYNKIGQQKDAKTELEEILRINSDFQPARQALRKLSQRK